MASLVTLAGPQYGELMTTSETCATTGSIAPPLMGPRHIVPTVAGDVCMYVRGRGQPLLLIHSVNAAASSAEVRPLAEKYRHSRRVYSMDLPGFGLSERAPRAYSPRLMTDAILAAVQVIRESTGRQSVDAIALSLGCEFLARAAVEEPTWFRSLALVSPTGLNGGRFLRKPEGSTLESPLVCRIVSNPLLGKRLFKLLTKPVVIRYFLKKSWGSRHIDEELYRYDLQTVRQPGAEYAPLRFLCGALFSADIQNIYQRLAMPVWMARGVHVDFNDYRHEWIVSRLPNWSFSRFSTGAFPHFEALEYFCEDYDRWMEQVVAPRYHGSAPQNTNERRYL
jgi:pimeloyl-ACP methyl ester carboxylesterase